eukprot:TRINITY_DN26804_c0_g1_i1.p1 TRINITY_DN26804_c0_g1~~TRINITY_DN26804_c0_g1_i1.p1  ORF type:complete len:102 (-),score=4.05 TRINITY_DN26804_c0_g1_i1:161-466(-)
MGYKSNFKVTLIRAYEHLKHHYPSVHKCQECNEFSRFFIIQQTGIANIKTKLDICTKWGSSIQNANMHKQTIKWKQTRNIQIVNDNTIKHSNRLESCIFKE